MTVEAEQCVKFARAELARVAAWRLVWRRESASLILLAGVAARIPLDLRAAQLLLEADMYLADPAGFERDRLASVEEQWHQALASLGRNIDREEWYCCDVCGLPSHLHGPLAEHPVEIRPERCRCGGNDFRPDGETGWPTPNGWRCVHCFSGDYRLVGFSSPCWSIGGHTFYDRYHAVLYLEGAANMTLGAAHAYIDGLPVRGVSELVAGVEAGGKR